MNRDLVINDRSPAIVCPYGGTGDFQCLRQDPHDQEEHQIIKSSIIESEKIQIIGNIGGLLALIFYIVSIINTQI